MRNRQAWLAAIAAALGISEEACRRDAAPQSQTQPVVTAASSSTPTASAPSASADIAPSATASATTIASAAPKASANPFATSTAPWESICGAVPPTLVNPSVIGSGGPGIGTFHNNPSCGHIGTTHAVPTSPRADLTMSVSGGSSGDEHIAMSLRPRFRACANQALAQDPTMQGKLGVIVAIGVNGEVTRADVANNTGVSAAAAQCMLRHVKNAQFPGGAARTIQLAIVQSKQSP